MTCRLLETMRQKLRRALPFRRALTFAWQSAKGWLIVSAVLTAIQGLLPLVQLYLTKLMVDAVTAGVHAADREAAFRHVLLLVGCMAAASLFSFFVQSLATCVSQWQAFVVTDHMNEVLLAKSVEVDLAYFETPTYYNTLHRAQREAASRPINIVNGLGQICQSAIALLTIAGLLLTFHWAIAAILFITVCAGAAVRLRYTGKIYRWLCEQTAPERKANYLSGILTDSAHAKEVRLFNLGPLFIQRVAAIRQALRKRRLEILRSRTLVDLMSQTVATAAIYGAYAYVALQTISGQITLGDLVMYFQAFLRVQGYLKGILGNLTGLYENNLYLTDLYAFLDLRRTVPEPTTPCPVPRPMRQGIVLDHVGFQYPGGDRQAIRDVSLHIQPGEVVALVGANGSGKTTLVKLLCRLYDPDSGSIAIDGVDLRGFETRALRNEIAVIFQDYARYHLSAADNIWLGNCASPPDPDRIADAARQAGADEVIRSLPQGYETMLGKRFDAGEELSTGEWQKVALARAFMRDAQILVMDEPTSSMDAKTELEVFENVRELVAGRTAILISHRFSTVRMADRIFVLEHGRIIEGGTHDELVSAGGTYARLFEMQAQHYR